MPPEKSAPAGSGLRDGATSIIERLSIPSVPSSIAKVRRFAVAACRQSGRDDLSEIVALLVSEVATNALVHGSGHVHVRVTERGSGLRVEVADDSPRMPQPRAASPLEEGGRGLALVESLAAAWGAEREGEGKIVWFDVS